MDLIGWVSLTCVDLLLVLDDSNSFHDTASMVASTVATRALHDLSVKCA